MAGIKLVFVGDTEVGKSCLITRFIKGVFETNLKETTKANYVSKTIEIPEIGESITFDIWDTNGREKFKSMARIFYKGAKMAILVYDTTRKESYDNIKNWWYKDIKEHGDPDIVIGIAGNKSDRYDDEEVSEQEAREFAESIGAVFSLTSAQNNSGIDELFKDMGKKYLCPNSSTIESDIQKPEQKEESNQNIKFGEKNVDKKNDGQKKKKNPCIII